jgi:hypothetical protein
MKPEKRLEIRSSIFCLVWRLRAVLTKSASIGQSQRHQILSFEVTEAASNTGRFIKGLMGIRSAAI